MDETYPAGDATASLGPPSAIGNVDVMPELSEDPTDRSMLVVQYAVAVIAAVCALLLSRAS